MSFGKRNGRPAESDFEDPLFQAKLDPAVAKLHQEVPDAKYDRKSLATFIMQLRKFMEDSLGKNGNLKPFPKLPVSLFQDFRPDGAISLIASRLHTLKRTRGLRKLDFDSVGLRRAHVDLLGQVRKELVSKGMLPVPVVHIHESLGDQVQQLKATVVKLGGQIAEAPDDPSVTHVVYPFKDGKDPDDGQEYMRVLEFKGDKALVHWWYLPDSYDEYVVRDLAPPKLEADKQVHGPWKVYLRWVTDSDKYNEWMNPIDYETEDAIEEQEAAARAAGQNPDQEDDGTIGEHTFRVPTVAEIRAQQGLPPGLSGAPANKAAAGSKPAALPAGSSPARTAGTSALASTAGPSTPSAAGAPSANTGEHATAGEGEPAASGAASATAGGPGDSTTAEGPATSTAAGTASGASAPPDNLTPTKSATTATDATPSAATTAPTPEKATAAASEGQADQQMEVDEPAPEPEMRVPTAGAAVAAEKERKALTVSGEKVTADPSPGPLPPKPAQPPTTNPQALALDALPVSANPLLASGNVLTVAGAARALAARAQVTKKQKSEHDAIEVEAGSAVRVAHNAIRWTSLSVHKTVTDGSSTVENLSQGQPLVIHGAVPGQPHVAPYPHTHTSTHQYNHHQQQHQQQQTAPGLEARASLQALHEGKAAERVTATGGIPSHSQREGVALNPVEQQLVASLQARNETIHYVPVYSAWFRWDEVHEIEEAALPDFFTGKYPSRGPRQYVLTRNALIRAYRQQPSKRLTATESRRLVNLDSEAVSRIWDFLDKWGLINHQALDDSAYTYASMLASLRATSAQHAQHEPHQDVRRMSMDSAADTGKPQEATENAHSHHSHTSNKQETAGEQGSDHPRPSTPAPQAQLPKPLFGNHILTSQIGHQSVILSLKHLSQSDALMAAASGGNGPYAQGVSLRKPTGPVTGQKALAEAAIAAARATAPSQRFTCSAMPWVDCTEARYTCLKNSSINLCPAAYAEGRFPPGCGPKDFVKIDRKTMADANTEENGWHPAETLQLLEALEIHGDKWDAVSQHVGTKTQVQCIMHFLSMGIEDGFLDDLEQHGIKGIEPDTSSGNAFMGVKAGTNVDRKEGQQGKDSTAPAGRQREGVVNSDDGDDVILPIPKSKVICLPAPKLPPSTSSIKTEDGNHNTSNRNTSGQHPANAEGDTDMQQDGSADGGDAAANGNAHAVTPDSLDGLLSGLPESSEITADVAQQMSPLFADAANPIMAHAAMISLLMGPKLAGEFAQEAMAELSMLVMPPEDDDAHVDHKQKQAVKDKNGDKDETATTAVGQSAVKHEVNTNGDAGGAKTDGIQGNDDGKMDVDNQQQQQGKEGSGDGVAAGAGKDVNDMEVIVVDSDSDQDDMDDPLPTLDQVTVPPEAMRTALNLALISTAAKARLMAEQQEREMYRLMNQAISLQSAKIEAKVKYLSLLDTALEAEIPNLNKLRESITQERVKARELRRNPPAPAPQAAPIAIAQSTALPAAATTAVQQQQQQQVGGATMSAQVNISNVGTVPQLAALNAAGKALPAQQTAQNTLAGLPVISMAQPGGNMNLATNASMLQQQASQQQAGQLMLNQAVNQLQTQGVQSLTTQQLMLLLQNFMQQPPGQAQQQLVNMLMTQLQATGALSAGGGSGVM